LHEWLPGKEIRANALEQAKLIMRRVERDVGTRGVS
jgi:cob(I)alamin adenosyltransferase